MPPFYVGGLLAGIINVNLMEMTTEKHLAKILEVVLQTFPQRSGRTHLQSPLSMPPM